MYATSLLYNSYISHEVCPFEISAVLFFGFGFIFMLLYLEPSSSLKERQEAIITDLKTTTKKSVVFIDDIDRLQPNHILEVLQLIKANANWPNFIYVVAFDFDEVEKRIKSLSKNENPSTPNYLDKIFQIQIKLPMVYSNDLMNYLGKKVDAIQKHFGKDNDLLSYKYFQEKIYTKRYTNGSVTDQYIFNAIISKINIRDINRIFNNIAILLAIMKKNNGNDIPANIFDLFIIEFIRAKYSELYKQIIENYTLIYSTIEDLGNSQAFEGLDDADIIISFSAIPRQKENEKSLFSRRYFKNYLLLQSEDFLSDKQKKEFAEWVKLGKEDIFQARFNELSAAQKKDFCLDTERVQGELASENEKGLYLLVWANAQVGNPVLQNIPDGVYRQCFTEPRSRFDFVHYLALYIGDNKDKKTLSPQVVNYWNKAVDFLLGNTDIMKSHRFYYIMLFYKENVGTKALEKIRWFYKSYIDGKGCKIWLSFIQLFNHHDENQQRSRFEFLNEIVGLKEVKEQCDKCEGYITVGEDEVRIEIIKKLNKYIEDKLLLNYRKHKKDRSLLMNINAAIRDVYGSLVRGVRSRDYLEQCQIIASSHPFFYGSGCENVYKRICDFLDKLKDEELIGNRIHEIKERNSDIEALCEALNNDIRIIDIYY